MIIFGMDGVLADCEHRRHFIDPSKYPHLYEYSNYRIINGEYIIDLDGKASWRHKSTGEPFKHGMESYWQACDKDKPILHVMSIFKKLWDIYDTPIQIWSDRSQSYRDKTSSWLIENSLPVGSMMKMRPIGNTELEEVLKEMWLNERCADHIQAQIDGKPFGIKHDIEFVFESHKPSIEMYRHRGIFVFDCNQG